MKRNREKDEGRRVGVLLCFDMASIAHVQNIQNQEFAFYLKTKQDRMDKGVK